MSPSRSTDPRHSHPGFGQAQTWGSLLISPPARSLLPFSGLLLSLGQSQCPLAEQKAQYLPAPFVCMPVHPHPLLPDPQAHIYACIPALQAAQIVVSATTVTQRQGAGQRQGRFSSAAISPLSSSCVGVRRKCAFSAPRSLGTLYVRGGRRLYHRRNPPCRTGKCAFYLLGSEASFLPSYPFSSCGLWWVGAVHPLLTEVTHVFLGVENINSAVALRALALVALLFLHRPVGLSVLLWLPFLQSRHAVYVRLRTDCVHEQYGNGH
jgi:hypothetical protein